jgi:uncharacterized membrane protein
MNNTEKAKREINAIGELQKISSPYRRLSPLSKLFLTVLYIFVTVSFGKYDIVALSAMIIFPVIAFQFSQALFLYIDHQEMSAFECLRSSRSWMRGHIVEFFRLHLSLAGYFALCVISMGVGLIWVLPYLDVIKANYYRNLTGTYKPY